MGAAVHATRIVHLEDELRAYAEEHHMTVEEVLQKVPYWKQQISKRYRERQYKTVIDQYIASKGESPDPKIVGYLVALRCSGQNLSEVLPKMSDEDIQEAVLHRMSEIRAMVSHGPQKQIDNAIREGRWVGGSNFSSTTFRVANCGRISMCWGSGEEDDEYSQAYSGVLSVGTHHRGKLIQLRPYKTANEQLYLAFWDTTSGDYLRNRRERSVLLRQPSKMTLIVKRDSQGRRVITSEYRQQATEAFDRYLQAEYEQRHEEQH